MLSLISVVILLAWCSTTKINQSGGVTNENTWEVSTGAIDSGIINNDIISWEVVDTIGETAATETWIITWSSDIIWTNPQTPALETSGSSEEDALKAKIRELIEKRRIESKPATGLTEEDIQLMEDILKEIIEETNNK